MARARAREERLRGVTSKRPMCHVFCFILERFKSDFQKFPLWLILDICDLCGSSLPRFQIIIIVLF